MKEPIRFVNAGREYVPALQALKGTAALGKQLDRQDNCA